MRICFAVAGVVRAKRAVGYFAVGMSVALFSALGGCSGGSKSEPGPVFNPNDSLHVAGYAFGRDLGRNIPEMRELGVQFNDTMVLLGLREALAGAPAQMSDSLLKVATTRFNGGFRAKQRQKRRLIEEENLKVANAFLEQQKAAPGVIVTASGLQYTVLKEGTGPKLKLNDKVKINYHGTLPDGKVIGSSVDRGAPISVSVGDGILPGWTEVLQLMKVGSKYKVVLPPDLAYGRYGSRPLIAPNSALIYEIEVVEIEKPEVAKK